MTIKSRTAITSNDINSLLLYFMLRRVFNAPAAREMGRVANLPRAQSELTDLTAVQLRQTGRWVPKSMRPPCPILTGFCERVDAIGIRAMVEKTVMILDVPGLWKRCCCGRPAAMILRVAARTAHR